MKKFTQSFVSFLTACLVLAIFIFSQTVYAADGFPIHIQPLLQTGIGYLFMAIVVFVGWTVTVILRKFSKKLGVEVDDKTRAYLDIAIMNGIFWARRRVEKSAGDLKDPYIDNALIAEAANYVLAKVPDALSHFKISQEGLATLIEARLSKVGENDAQPT